MTDANLRGRLSRGGLLAGAVGVAALAPMVGAEGRVWSSRPLYLLQLTTQGAAPG